MRAKKNRSASLALGLAEKPHPAAIVTGVRGAGHLKAYTPRAR